MLEETVLEETQTLGNTGLTNQDPQEVTKDPEENKVRRERRIPY